MRIVLDTNILVRAGAKARGPARELLQLIVASPRHVLLLSPFLLRELERVFSYERVRVLSKLADEEVAEYLRYLRAKDVSELVFAGTVLAGRPPVLCRPIETMTRWFTLPLWGRQIYSARSTAILIILSFSTTVVSMAY